MKLSKNRGNVLQFISDTHYQIWSQPVLMKSIPSSVRLLCLLDVPRKYVKKSKES